MRKLKIDSQDIKFWLKIKIEALVIEASKKAETVDRLFQLVKFFSAANNCWEERICHGFTSYDLRETSQNMESLFNTLFLKREFRSLSFCNFMNSNLLALEKELREKLRSLDHEASKKSHKQAVLQQHGLT